MNVKWLRLFNHPKGYKYRALNAWTYFSPRYKRAITIPRGFECDGASGPAWDIGSDAWGVHDVLCRLGTWDDKTPLCNWQASSVLGDILRADGHWARASYWKYATLFFGCDAAKANGMFKVKQGRD